MGRDGDVGFRGCRGYKCFNDLWFKGFWGHGKDIWEGFYEIGCFWKGGEDNGSFNPFQDESIYNLVLGLGLMVDDHPFVWFSGGFSDAVGIGDGEICVTEEVEE